MPCAYSVSGLTTQQSGSNVLKVAALEEFLWLLAIRLQSLNWSSPVDYFTRIHELSKRISTPFRRATGNAALKPLLNLNHSQLHFRPGRCV